MAPSPNPTPTALPAPEALTRLADALRAAEGLALRENEPLSAHTSMGVGGPARLFAEVETPGAAAALMRAVDETGVPWMMLGGGSNTIFTDGGWPGLIVTLGRGLRRMEPGPEPHQVTAGAGVALSALMNFGRRQGLAGFEWAAGIPGTLGGALAGNAGTPKGDMCSQTAAVEVIEPDGARRRLARGAFAFAYRRSDLMGRFILGATLDGAPDDPAAIGERIEAGLAKRREQPLGVRCSGCMFKNPADDHAGRLIDAAGLKNLRVGGARVSDRHANFIINEGQATTADVLALMEQVRRRVREQAGVELETEIRIVGLDSGQLIQ